jgi:hypothetical protein
MNSYQKKLRALLSPAERQLFAKLSTPKKIQDYLDTLSINFEYTGEILIFSPREVVKRKKAHCIEGALLAAAALAYHGQEPLLLDLRSKKFDYDHVVALYSVQDRSALGGKTKKRWGAISKTNHPVLRYRDPVYQSVRELVMSYYHEYFMGSGRQVGQKTLQSYSRPFNLRRYDPITWVVAMKDLDWLAQDLDNSLHFPVASQNKLLEVRKASSIEIVAGNLVEYKKPKK